MKAQKTILTVVIATFSLQAWGLDYPSSDITSSSHDSNTLDVPTSTPSIFQNGFESNTNVLVTTSLLASPESITEGGNSTISWQTENATSCTPSGGTEGWDSSTIGLPSGSMQTKISTAGTYEFTLTCFGASDQDSSSKAVTVIEPSPTCDVTLTSSTVRNWEDVFGSPWPAPSQTHIRVSIPERGYHAVRFDTGEIVDAGLLSNIEIAGTSGMRFGAVSELAGCFKVTDECKYAWGRNGGIVWDTTGTAESCQLKSNTTYYWNMTFTDGVTPDSSTCLGTYCETFLLVVNPD